ncbi:hypothetical protein [Paramicrobacterium chengjingii]|uniref:hypothetical protein n=1 Tax=Paramicrobacterium chengjingii TaxID=2769067 RepID=UPI00142341C6|nr:hypothetical protein [Microbacterium chengjingii]
MQGLALRSGWKLRRNRLLEAHEIPFWNRNTSQWVLPDREGGAQIINRFHALEMLDAAGAFTKKGVIQWQG